ncbi:class I SAM-dependent rRNA methyltransferase [Caldalkalibacillus salinus]|uniref:class I SAM-dependent rRNA methyltransferase n=1 Tax=Caldalkalibacillus salinus TaxID=2803787 RepID=UPI0019220978|nr:class I SAM-dependent rRNA methyltransferase [Caldalkalibacillus salinus]
MTASRTLKVKPAYTHKFKKGYPLLTLDALLDNRVDMEEGDIFRLVDERGAFIAKGYYGRQNKGHGWILTSHEGEEIDQAFFDRLVAEAVCKRSQLYHQSETTAFRVFNGEGDGIGGLHIDYFDGYYLIHWYSRGIYAFKPLVLQALENVVSYKGIYEKKRFGRQGGTYVEDDDFVKGEKATFPLMVKENGMKFAVYLNEGAMVGFFLDQREVRKVIRDHYAEGKSVLNTFSYTGAFSVAAALGGASKTTSVDVANRSLSKTIEQFSLNGIDYEAQDIIVEDVFKYFNYAAKKQQTYDMVILDPPSFARTKKHTFSATKDYKRLLKDIIPLTEAGGMIVASTNSASLSMKKFKRFIDSAFKEKGGSYNILETYTLPKDFKTLASFREGHYLKVVFIKKEF